MTSTGVREQNNLEKRAIKGLILNEEQFIQSLRIFANTSTLSGLGSTEGGASNAPQDPSGNYFSRSGDFFVGQIGRDYAIVTISGDTIDVSKTIGTTSPLIVLNPEGGSPDDLTTITPGVDIYPFQELFIRTVNEDITFKDTGNIITPGSGGNFVVPPGNIVYLIYDTILTVWRIVASTTGFGGGSSSPSLFINVVKTVSPEATLNVDLSEAQHWVINLSENITITFINPPSNEDESEQMVLEFIQDGTGGRTVSYSQTISPAAPVLNTTSLAREVVTGFARRTTGGIVLYNLYKVG